MQIYVGQITSTQGMLLGNIKCLSRTEGIFTQEACADEQLNKENCISSSDSFCTL